MVSPHGRDLIIWIVVFTILNLTALGLRFYTMIKVKRRSLRADDYIIVFSICSLLALEGTSLWAIHNGLGYHTAEVQWEQVAVQIKLVTSSYFTWTLSTTSCKVAVLVMYLDIFRTDVGFRRAVYVLIGLCTLYPIVFIPFFVTVCNPVWAAWDPILSQTNCRPLEVQEIASVAVNLFLDFAVVTLPIPVVWKLQMPTNKKLGVTAMFSLGLGVIGILIWRMIDTVSPGHGDDLVYDLYVLALQSHLECWLGILAANIPALGPLLNRLSPSKITTYLKSGGNSSNNDSRPYHRGLSLKTFGSSRVLSRPGRDDFQLLSDSERALHQQGGIIMNQEFRVSVESSPDRNLKNGHSVGIAT
ncbi:hypothetical protein F4775DRAFT_593288 [Biscogniauxia sp. FL1348]|nr:hypothetical protein F4775DRAFT_593288 [Biscogniauxia sp. FL1348]